MSVDFVFLDSGTGGIPYLNWLLKKCPEASCVYTGDTENFPYGEKSHEEIVKCVLSVVEKIIRKFEPKVIVIACNTMSVNALNVVRDAFPEVQFVGTVPAIKLAASVSKNRCIGLMATQSTVDNPYNQDLKNHFAGDCRMVLHAAPELIEFIEHKAFTATEEEILEAVKPSADFFKAEGCDAVILGCTHFLNIADLIQKACGETIKVVDSKDGVVNHALDVWGRCGGKAPAAGVAEKAAAQAGDFGAKGAAPLLKPELYVTGFSDKKDKKEYDVICSRFGLSFEGLL